MLSMQLRREILSHRIRGINMPMEETTTIVLKLSTKERILGKGRMGESYDDVISRALDALDMLAKRRVHKDGRVDGE